MAEEKVSKGKRSKLSDEVRDQIIELIGEGLSTDEIQERLGLSESAVLRYVLFARVHGVEELRAMPTLIDSNRKASAASVAQMVEFAICYNIPSYMMEIFFKFRNPILRSCIDIRRSIGHALLPNIELETLPESADLEYFADYVAKHNEDMSLDDMLTRYRAQLELSEKDAQYLNVRVASDFRRYTRCKKSEIAALVQKYREQGLSNSKIAAMILSLT